MGKGSKKRSGAARHAAPGTYLGFGLQPERLACNLIEAPPGSTGYVEYDDDVSLRMADGSFLLEQTKSALTSKPARDTSVELWKTLANWAEWLEARGKGNLPTVRFRYFVAPVHSGPLVEQLHAANDGSSVNLALAAVHKLVSSATSPPKWQTHLRRFCNAPRLVQERVVANFEFRSEPDGLMPLRRWLAPMLKPGDAEDFLNIIIGHVKNTTDAGIRIRRIGEISRDEFHVYTQGAFERARLPTLVSGGPPSPDEVSVKLAASPTFVRQLQLVNAKDWQCTEAVTHFLQTEADKILWAERGRFLDGDVEVLEASLASRQRSIDLELSIVEPNLKPHVHGLLVYLRSQTIKVPIQEQMAPDFFICGCLHNLADRKAIGWHPAYTTLL